MKLNTLVSLIALSSVKAATNYLHANPTPPTNKVLGTIPRPDGGLLTVAVRGITRKQLGSLESRDRVNYEPTFTALPGDDMGNDGYTYAGGSLLMDDEYNGSTFVIARRDGTATMNFLYRCDITNGVPTCKEATMTPLLEEVPKRYVDIAAFHAQDAKNRKVVILLLVAVDCKAQAYLLQNNRSLMELGVIKFPSDDGCDQMSVVKPRGHADPEALVFMTREDTTDVLSGTIELTTSGGIAWKAGSIATRRLAAGITGVAVTHVDATDDTFLVGVFGGKPTKVDGGMALTRELTYTRESVGLSAPKKLSQWKLGSWNGWMEAIAPLAGKDIPNKKCAESEISEDDEKTAFVFDYNFEGDFTAVPANKLTWKFTTTEAEKLEFTFSNDEVTVTLDGEEVGEPLSLPTATNSRRIILVLDTTVTELYIAPGANGVSLTVPHRLKGTWKHSCLLQSGKGMIVGKGSRIRREGEKPTPSVDAATALQPTSFGNALLYSSVLSIAALAVI